VFEVKWSEGDVMNDGVLLIGDPRLRIVCDPVTDVEEPAFAGECRRLHAALGAFRAEHGFGRGIAAPQIGIPRRFIALNLNGVAWTLVNPAITWFSPETFTLWDDCMSFPDLLVRVRRFCSVSVSFMDEKNRPQAWESLGPAESELLQHEIDHLDGILAVDRALDARSIVHRRVFAADPAWFRGQVDDAPALFLKTNE
jgi:peptide deformylase